MIEEGVKWAHLLSDGSPFLTVLEDMCSMEIEIESGLKCRDL